MNISLFLFIFVYIITGIYIGTTIFNWELNKYGAVNKYSYSFSFVFIPAVWPIVLFLSFFKGSVFNKPMWSDM